MASRIASNWTQSRPQRAAPIDLLRALGRGAADLLLPIACICCDRAVNAGDAGIICGICWSRVRLLPSPRCNRCGHPVDRYSCRWCPLLPPYVRAARSYCWIGAGTGSEIIHAFKYDGWQRSGEAIAARIGRLAWPEDVACERTATVAVPLERLRERERGFNQSEVIARELALIWRIPQWTRVLERARPTRSQTELTPEERKGNVAGAFRVRPECAEALAGAHIILVDDIITTGATLHACSRALFDAGARTISYATFGRAPAAGDRVL